MKPERGFYYHYKHDPDGARNEYAYEVLGVGRHSEDESLYVMYRPLYQNTYFDGVDASVRPLEMFIGDVLKDGRTLPRFTKISDQKLLDELSAIRDAMYGQE